MRVLAPVIERATLAMFHPRQALPFRRAGALALIRDEHPWHIVQSLEQLADNLLRRLLVTAVLHEHVEGVVVLIHGAPQVMALPVDRQKHLVAMPCVPRATPSTLELVGVILPTLPTPLADGLVGHVDAALAQEFLHVAVAQREAIIQPDSRLMISPGKRWFWQRSGVSRWSHVRCLS